MNVTPTQAAARNIAPGRRSSSSQEGFAQSWNGDARSGHVVDAAVPKLQGKGRTVAAPIPLLLASLDDAADAFLVDRAADGDARAFAVLVRRYGRLLRAYAARMLGSTANSDDIVQEALVTAWQQLSTLEDRGAVRAWLVTITSRKALSFIRSAKHHDDVDDLEVAGDPDREPEAVARMAALDSSLSTALAALPDAQRRAWIAREMGDASYEDIATELELPVSTVRGLIARARKTLLQQMSEWR